MSETAVRVVARLNVKPDQVQPFLRLVKGLFEPTLEEQGCVSYEVLQNLTDPTEFTFVEHWASARAADEHMKTPHASGALDTVLKMITAPPDIRRYRSVRPDGT